MRIKKNLQGIVIFCVFSSPGFLLAAAFPGAEGFGARTRGAYALYEQTGSDSDLPRILHVTNLYDSGSGSFRAALEASGPRVVVFDIGGRINLSSDLQINNTSYLTIAGQTAPGDGICLYGRGLYFWSGHDIIIRGLRIRNTPNGKDAMSFRPVRTDGIDKSYNIIVDHCSFSWAGDEILSATGEGEYFTFSNNIIAEPVDPDGVEHAYGTLVGVGSKYFTLTKNLWVNVNQRTPLIGGSSTAMNESKGPTYIESVNNIAYNTKSWGPSSIASHSYYNGGGGQPQLVVLSNEYHKRGPGSEGTYTWTTWTTVDLESGSKIFFDSNITTKRTLQNYDDWDVCLDNKCQEGYRTNSWPFTSSGVAVVEAFANYENLIITDNGLDGDVPRIGAYPRDTHDVDVINDAASGTALIGATGAWLTSQPSVQSYSSGTTPTDTDRDGMPDSWETSKGLDPQDASDANRDRDGDGYYNIEEYANSFFIPGSSGDSQLSSPKGFKLEESAN